MFNQEYVGKVMDMYGVNNLIVARDGKVFAPSAVGAHVEIPGMQFDTDTMDGSVASEAIEKAKG